MSVKIFCSSCHQYIKDAGKNEIKNFTGDEICGQCATRMKSLFDEVEKIARRGIVEIEKKRDAIKAELEQSWKKVVKNDQT